MNWKKSKPNMESAMKSEIEALTDALILESFGPNGIVTKEFHDRLERFNAKDNPLGTKEAKALLVSMVKLAVAQRKTLIGRIEKSVETGSLYNRYYAKVQTVTQLAIQTEAYRKEADSALEEFISERENYRRNRVRSYETYNLTPEQEQALKDEEESLDRLMNTGGDV